MNEAEHMQLLQNRWNADPYQASIDNMVESFRNLSCKGRLESYSHIIGSPDSLSLCEYRQIVKDAGG